MKGSKNKQGLIVYAYTMRYDTGFAPAVDKGILSLACCKTNLRFRIAKDLSNNNTVILIGLCGKEMADRNGFTDSYFPVYMAKITCAIETKEYYCHSSKYKSRPDAKYKYQDEKWYILPNNPHHPGNRSCIELAKEDANNEKAEYRRNRTGTARLSAR